MVEDKDSALGCLRAQAWERSSCLGVATLGIHWYSGINPTCNAFLAWLWVKIAVGHWLYGFIAWHSSKDALLCHLLRRLWVTSLRVADVWRHCETPTGVTLVTWQSVTCQLVVWVKTFFSCKIFPLPSNKTVYSFTVILLFKPFKPSHFQKHLSQFWNFAYFE